MVTAGRLIGLGMLMFMASCLDIEHSIPDLYTLDSRQSRGFVFNDLKIIEFPNDSSVSPDFILLTQTNETGDLLAPFLTHPTLENRFALIGQFKDAGSARQFFESYYSPEATLMRQFAFDIKPNQVWLIKTSDGTYGKLLIVESGRININRHPYAILKFKAENF